MDLEETLSVSDEERELLFTDLLVVFDLVLPENDLEELVLGLEYLLVLEGEDFFVTLSILFDEVADLLSTLFLAEEDFMIKLLSLLTLSDFTELLDEELDLLLVSFCITFLPLSVRVSFSIVLFVFGVDLFSVSLEKESLFNVVLPSLLSTLTLLDESTLSVRRELLPFALVAS